MATEQQAGFWKLFSRFKKLLSKEIDPKLNDKSDPEQDLKRKSRYNLLYWEYKQLQAYNNASNDGGKKEVIANYILFNKKGPK